METTTVSSLGARQVSLSLSQREVWLDQCAWPDSAHLNIGGGAFLRGRFDLPRFKAALSCLVAENEALRLAPRLDGTQALLAQFEPTLEWVDLSGAANPEATMRVWWHKRIQQAFVLNGQPPWRFALLHASDELHGLTIQFHHLVMDGWGTAQVMQRWSQIYNALDAGVQPESTNCPDYLQFIDESNEYRDSQAFERDAAYWRSQMPTLPEPLVVRRYAPLRPEHLPRSRLAKQKIPRSDYAHLEAYASTQGTTAFNFFLAALALYFSRINGFQEVVLGIPSLNRSGRRFRSTPGMFVGVLALKVVVTESLTVADLLAATGSALRGALRHPRYPLSELGKALQLIRTGRDGLFDVLLSFERQDYSAAFGSARLVDSRQIFSGTARYPLGVTVCEFHPDQDIELVLDASSDCFATGEPALLGRRLWHLAQALMAEPSTPLEAISLLPPEEEWALLQGLHKAVASHEATQTYISQFEHQAALRPEATAVVWNGGNMDYATLDQKAEQLSRRLKASGTAAGAIMAVAIARSPNMMVALLGIAKAGAAFLPLDPEAPVARIAQILQDSAASALLIEKADAARFANLHGNTLVFDSNSPPTPEVWLDTLPAWIEPQPDDLAYVLFTSGSTGHPKGVMVTHATLSRRLAWLSRTYAVDWHDRSAQATQLTFDPSLIELFLPLIHGGSVAIPPPGRLLPESLADFAIGHGVTIMAFVPSTLSRFLDGAVGKTGLKLRVACCGGEVLPPELGNRFITETGARLYNVYRPTEAAIFASAWQCELHPVDVALPVGRPIDDTRIYVMNAQLQLMPLGVTGEVFIGGAALARGYLNRPELDAQVFLNDPFQPGARIYRTGDLGWLGLEGNLHFCGRIDRQIKLRGYRIELGEIEATCLALPGVLQAAAKLVADNGKPAIHVWVATNPGVNSHSLQQALRSRLPDYMIPAGIRVLDKLPQTSAGKVDFAALPEISRVPLVSGVRLPASALERDLMALWQAVLNPPTIGLADNFFDLGGDSLAAVSILTGIEKLLGRRVPMHLLIEHPTIEQLALALKSDVMAPSVLIELGSRSGQVPLYLAASGHGDLLRFQNLAHALGSACDVQLLQPPTDKAVATVAELAGLYATSIANQRLAPGFIAGFSVGGVAALETARLLRQQGVAIRGLVLLDTIYPKGALGGAMSWRILGWLVRHLHVQELSMNGRRLGAMFNDPGLISQVMALRGYQAASFDGPAWLIKSSGLVSWDRWFFRPWRRLFTAQLQELQVPGLHGSIFEASNVNALAGVITQVLQTRHDDAH
ncbi:MAG TPA: amino acid adenylation domain-containing protein [Rhodoferax sp.]|nr:amino acid adenylation domain-containing protein [Rhodoferax sp.]